MKSKYINFLLNEKQEQLNDISFKDIFIELKEDLIDLNKSIKENERNIVIESKITILRRNKFRKIIITKCTKKFYELGIYYS